MTAAAKHTGLYTTLGVRPNAAAASIKRAYRKLARKHHPDANPGDLAAVERFHAVQRAYDVLSDPDRRRAYDADGTAERPVADEEVARVLVPVMFEMLQAAERESWGGGLARVDVRARMAAKLKSMLATIRDNLKNTDRSIAGLAVAAGRFAVPAGAVNVFEEAITAQLRIARDHRDRVARELAGLERAAAFLDGVTYRRDGEDGKVTPAERIMFDWAPGGVLGGWRI